MPLPSANPHSRPSLGTRALNRIEAIGNKLPEPSIIFLVGLIFIWFFSALLSQINFAVIDPRTEEPIVIPNLLSSTALADFITSMVTTFTNFTPVGVVLVVIFGVGMAENSGLIRTGIKLLLRITPSTWLTPMIIGCGILSHIAADVGYVLVIPLAGVIFYSVGRHPLVGIAAAFAGVSGSFCASFLPSTLDALLHNFTLDAAIMVQPYIEISPLNNWHFSAASSVF